MHSPLPRRLREAWWVYGAATALIALFGAGLLVRLRCTLHGQCGGPARLLDLDALGGLPRLTTTAMFGAAAVLAWRGARRASGRSALWWSAIGVVGAVLAVLKLLSTHSVAKADSAVLTLLGSVLLAGLALGTLWLLGRRWAVAGSSPVVLALSLYAAAAIGLDALTWAFGAVQTETGALSEAAATFVEELGEALTAMVLLVTVRRQTAARGVGSARG